LHPTEPLPVTSGPPAVRGVRLTFERDSLQRALAYLEPSEHGGLVTHIFAIQALLPTVFIGANGEAARKLTVTREAVYATISRLFVKLRFPRHALSAKDLEDRASRNGLLDLLAAVRDARGAEEPASAAPIVLEGPLDVAQIIRHGDALASEPLGSARPWLVLAHLLPSTVVTPAGGDARLATYRSVLIATLTNVSALPGDEFLRVLDATHNAALDAALADVRAALRDALEATAAHV
jgi:hypothetical protein